VDIMLNPWIVFNSQDNNRLKVILPEVAVLTCIPCYCCFLGQINKSTSFSSSGHKKPNGLMFIFSFDSSSEISEGMKFGGCLGKDGREGDKGIRWDAMEDMIFSGRLCHMGCMQFAASCIKFK